MTNEEHNKYIAWAFLATGIFQVAILLFMFIFLFAFFAAAPPGGGDFPAGIMASVFGLVLIINLVFLSPNFIAAYALLNRKPWARIIGIVAAALSAMNVPLGTLAAVYSLWFFCGDQWKSVYPEKAGEGNFDPLRITPPSTSHWEGYTKDEEGAYVHRTPPPPDWR